MGIKNMSIAKIIRLALIICLIVFGVGACGKDQPEKKTEPAGTQKIRAPRQQQDAKTTVNKTEAAAPAENLRPQGEAVAAESPGEPAIETPEAPEDFYNPVGKVDPFKPLVKDKQVAVAVPASGGETVDKRKRAHLTPLEKVDLSQLKLDGVILASSGNRAMVSDATGKGYVVTAGTYIGIYSGRVVEILPDKIVIEEEVENIFGKISLRRREMNMQKPLGE